MQAAVGVGELPLVNDETGLEVTGQHFRNDSIERDDHGFDLGSKEFEGEIGGGEFSGYGDASALNIVERERMAGHEHGAVTFANRASTGHQRVVLLKVGIRVKGDGCHVVEGFVYRLLVQRFDVGETVRELETGNADLVCGQSIKHEGIIGVRTMGNTDLADG